jgi:hypothetical protein
MAKKLSDFLIDLTADSKKLRRYAKDRDAVLAESGLSPEHQKLLKDENTAEIDRIVRRERPGEGTVAVNAVC